MGKITRRELSGGLVSELNKTGRLDELTTLDKTNLVKAINEVDAKEVDLTPINNKLEDIEGVGRTTETIKKNAEDIILVDTKVSEHLADNATLAKEGHVRLNSATDSTDETTAATPKAVKSAYDLAQSAFTSANNGKKQLETSIIGKQGTVSKTGEVASFSELSAGISSIPEGAGIKSVQRGTANVRTGHITNITISPVDISKTIVIVNSRQATDADTPAVAMVTGHLVDSSRLQLTKGDPNNNTAYTEYQVIEFQNVKSVQHSSVSVSSTSPVNSYISAVDPTKTFLYGSCRNTYSGNSSRAHQYTYRLVGSNRIEVTTKGVGTSNLEIYAVEFL